MSEDGSIEDLLREKDAKIAAIEDLLQEKDAKIAALESQKESQQEQIILLREEIGSTDIKHKEEIYWMRLEVDTLRRENEALEDRVQQVYRDIREEEVFSELEAPNGYDSAYVNGLQSQVGKYIRTLGILDNQIVMVKSSCDEVVKSLKEEIGDVMEEKCRVEMDLLNQLTVLDSEKRELEIAYDQQMKLKNEQIADLKKMAAKDSSVVSGVQDREEELLNEINDLKELMKILQDKLEGERTDADVTIARLEDANADLEQKIEAMKSDLEVMQEGAATAEAISLKEAIENVMEEKRRMEMDLLNQLTVLGSEKQELAIAHDQQMKLKKEQIVDLKKTAAKDSSVVSGVQDREEELLNEINDLKESKKILEDELEAERADADDAIARLEDANADLEQEIEAMKSDLEVMREGAAMAEAIDVLDALTRDRQDTLTNLDRVAMIWEKADDSIHGLEEIMDNLRHKSETNDQGDRERILSTLETASLVHGQIKVSLLLIELKLRNQLSSLKNDKLRMGHGGILAEKDASIGEGMQEIQKEALSMLDMVEKSLTDQIMQIGEAERDETKKMQETLQEKTEELKKLQAQHTSLETEISELRRKEGKEKKQSTDEKENGSAEMAVSKAVLERLQAEVLTVVERVKEKNDKICKSKTMIEEHKVREAALKKELRRIMKGSSRETEEKEISSGSGRRQTRRNPAEKTKTVRDA